MRPLTGSVPSRPTLQSSSHKFHVRDDRNNPASATIGWDRKILPAYSNTKYGWFYGPIGLRDAPRIDRKSTQESSVKCTAGRQATFAAEVALITPHGARHKASRRRECTVYMNTEILTGKQTHRARLENSSKRGVAG